MVKTMDNNIKGNPTGGIVLTAIKKLMQNTGWSARTIVNFIKLEYSVNNDPTLNRKVNRALKRGVKLGLLHLDHGRYRLNVMSRLAAANDSNAGYKRRQVKKSSPPLMRPLRIRSRSRSLTQHKK